MNAFGRALLSVSLVCAISASAGADEFAYCTVCHGAQGNGNVVIGAPKIAGLDTDYLARQLRAFRSGWRGTAEADRSGLRVARCHAQRVSNSRSPESGWCCRPSASSEHAQTS